MPKKTRLIGGNSYVTNGLPAVIPGNLSLSGVPNLGEFLQNIDPWDHTAHITKETVTLRIVTHHLNTSETGLNIIQFNIYNAD